MSECFLIGRSGAALAVRIVRSLERPAVPTENLIWFKTDILSGEWLFSANAPSENDIKPGLIWIEPRPGSIKVDLLRRNSIVTELGQSRIYYLSGDKMVNKRLDGEIYQGGKWHVFSTYRTYIYNKGDMCTDLTGGWAYQPVSGWTEGWFQANTDNLSGGVTNSHSAIFVTTLKPIPMKWYKRLGFSFTWVRNDWSGGLLKNRIPSTTDLAVYGVKKSGVGVLTLDVSKLTTAMYPTLYAYTDGPQKGFTVDQIWLES